MASRLNQQALLHAENYLRDSSIASTAGFHWTRLRIWPAQVIKQLKKLKSNFDLARFSIPGGTQARICFHSSGLRTSAFYFVPFIHRRHFDFSLHYWKTNPNFLSIISMPTHVFIVMTVYLSFTVRAEMYFGFGIVTPS